MRTLLALMLAVVVGVGGAPASAGSVDGARVGGAGVAAEAAAPGRVVPRAEGPLVGRTIVLDPGHQVGNSNYPRRINRQVPAGGFHKACNTTGTATNAGYPEATFAWRVAQRLRRQLVARGARVLMTRTSNRADRWGPCVDERGRAGNRIGADLKLSIHGDGSTSGGRGFHVIAPTSRRGWTNDIYRPSRRLALAVRRALGEAGLPRATYIAGGDGLDFRGDLGTLNLSDVPVVMAELGNMRNARDARLMVRRPGVFASALRKAAVAYLG
ncbi:N-acetylmuramoyl-L-alanine amidase [Nocardioides pacificus]